MHFDSPWAFLLLLLIPIILWHNQYRRTTGAAVKFSSVDNAVKAGKSLRQKLSFIPILLRILALILMIIVLARPQVGMERIKDINQGIAIEVVLDKSSSMGAEMEYKGTTMTRLDVVKHVFRDFILGDGHGLSGRPNDLVGMVAFARYADTICPLTLAHGALEPFLDKIQLVTRRDEDGTSLGDAIALAAARLKRAEDTLSKQTGKKSADYHIKSKIMILLTDGASNAGKRDPLAAAKLAKKWGIKIYAIGIGGGNAFQTIQTMFGNFKAPAMAAFDEDALKQIADITGGIYRSAGSGKTLEAVYKEINKMEKSKIESIRYMDYKEQFVPYALLALVLIIVEAILRQTIFRKLP